MKLQFISISIIAGITLLSSCEKKNWERSAPEDKVLATKAFLKVYNATIASPTTHIYVDGTIVTGATIGYTGLFPASTTYSAVEQGSRSINIKDPAAAPKLNLTVAGNFEAGKHYTLMTYDSLNTAKTKLVVDDLQIPLDTVTRLRFANILFSSVAIPNMDIYSQNAKMNVFTNVPVAEVTPYINHISKRSDTFYMRATGTTTNLNTLIFSPDQKRNYTLIARGRYQTTSGTTARTLTFMTNY